jgi:hypothetical protein
LERGKGDERRFEGQGLPDLVLGGLDDEAAATLVAQHAGHVADSVRDVLIRGAAGNALALVELPAALSEGQLAGTETLP